MKNNDILPRTTNVDEHWDYFVSQQPDTVEPWMLQAMRNGFFAGELLMIDILLVQMGQGASSDAVAVGIEHMRQQLARVLDGRAAGRHDLRLVAVAREAPEAIGRRRL